MRPCKHWTNKEIDILKKEYPYGDSKNMELLLKRNFNAIRTKAVRLKIKRKIIPNLKSNNGMWKGDNVGYRALHLWIKKNKPKPTWCEECFSRKSYDLANISGKYKRDIKDFKWLCRFCHMNNDGRLRILALKKRRKIKENKLYCSKCKQYKLKENFWIDNNRIDGYNINCKQCLRSEPKFYSKKCVICKKEFNTIFINKKTCSKKCHNIDYKKVSSKCGKNRYNFRKQNNLCVKCGKINKTNNNLCKKCNDNYNANEKIRYKKWKN